MVELRWHPYRYYPYELELARREVNRLLPKVKVSTTANGLRLHGEIDPKVADRLVYFASLDDGRNVVPTMQARLERVNGNGPGRQSTRYSAHGLHEYKGKFNPQVARAILNVLSVPHNARVIDPFCGSGTSLVESTHLGMRAIGTDINPLAVFIANAKLAAVRLPVKQLLGQLEAVLLRYKKASDPSSRPDARRDYLLSWFDKDVFNSIERLRIAILAGDESYSAPLLAIASNMLREYSLQDPNDLRIRRRKSPLPETPFICAFEERALRFFAKLSEAQSVMPLPKLVSKARLLDSRGLRPNELGSRSRPFDCALTSPPYATALPYIDTQRLSLVWLGLVAPSGLRPLEARLVGSREVHGKSKRDLLAALQSNSAGLPVRQANYCKALQLALTPADGFRRQAVPLLLYRYFADMAQVFRALRPLMKHGAPFALIVGGNHTVLSNRRFDIDTPRHLADIATACGWEHLETVPLQTYQRYGYHMNNSVSSEGLVIVRAL